MFKNVLYWFAASTLLIVGAFLYFDRSLMSDMVVFIWVISGIAATYIAKKKQPKTLSSRTSIALALFGLLVAFSSFINQFIAPTVFWNEPYSLGEFGVLLSGLSIALFALLRYRNLIIPVALPALVLFCAQVYDSNQGDIEKVASPLLGPTTGLTVFLLNLLGIEAKQLPGYIIQYMSQNGLPMNVQIVIDCTGVWSLSAFTASLIIVSAAFPKLFSKKNAKMIAFGYMGTYAANILRILAICLSGYFYGYGGVVEETHKHAGWIAFSGWMIIFWYLFFSRNLLSKEAAKKEPQER